MIDLTTALPPSPAEIQQELSRVLSVLASREDLGALIRKNRVGGNPRDRTAAVAWLAPRLGVDLNVDRLLVTNGTQSALLLLLHALVGNGGVLATEDLTYVVLRTLAARLNVTVVGIALDEEGIVPEAFAEVCVRHHPRALYCNPTVHNPTAAVMSERRRLEVIRVARQHGVTIFEDDVLGALHPESAPPIAALAPDITWYVMSLSKCYAMGLRVAYLAAPSRAQAEELLAPVHRLSWWFPNSLSAEIASRWALDGGGRRIAAAVRSETQARQEIAASILDMRLARTAPGALHLWMHLPARHAAGTFAAMAQERGVLVRPADLFAIDAARAPNAVRVSLTGPESRDELRRGLVTLATLLDSRERTYG